MATNLQEVEKHEIKEHEGVERTRPRKVFVPRADIYETSDEIVVLADVPGVDEKTIDITLEKNILSIKGIVECEFPPDHALTYAEYEIGDYQRVFTLSDEVDRDGIKATVKNGVLRLTLPKSRAAKTKKITVQAE